MSFNSRIGLALASVVCLAASGALGQGGPPKVSPVDVEGALAGRRVSLVLVKDFMKIENAGGLLQSVEFPRYFPAADGEQVVLGRWLSAQTPGGTSLPIDSPGAREDPAGNLVQSLRIRPLPARQPVTVTITTLVARRERPSPSGVFPIPKAEEYPANVRPYLASTPMVDAEHEVVRETARTILAKTHDAMSVAAEIARLARQRTYLPSGGGDEALPVSAGVLKHGGSCCASAVAAAAVLRACGIPAQVTYCPPPSYVHGIVRFWLHGYGWVRMDATSGTGRLPLTQGADDLSLVRVFDTPIQMEQMPMAYAWPYQHNDLTGEYQFTSGGDRCEQVRMFYQAGGELPFVQEPFPHLEPGSWSAVLGSEAIEGPWEDWKGLVEASRKAALEGVVGPFEGVCGRIPAAQRYAEVAATWGMPAEGGSPAPPPVR